MKDLDTWLDPDEPGPYDERAFLDGANRVPDMTPVQKERLDRKLHAAIAAQGERLTRDRRAKRALCALGGALVAACCGGALLFALHGAPPPHPRSSGIESVSRPVARTVNSTVAHGP